MTQYRIISLILGMPRPFKRLIVLVSDLISCILSIYLAFFLRLGEWVPLFSSENWDPLPLLGASILSLPIFFAYGMYREIFRHSGRYILLVLIKSISIYTIFIFLVFVVIGINGIPRTVGFIQPILLLLLVGASRTCASYWLRNPYRKQIKLNSIPKVLIYGAGEAGIQLYSALANSNEMQVLGFVDDNLSLQGSYLGGKLIYSPQDLSELVIDFNINKVLLAIPSASRFRRNQIIKLVGDSKVDIETLPSMDDLAQGKVTTSDLRSLDIDDLLEREIVLADSELLAKNTHQKIVMVTGAGGSIGSELCRQILLFSPKTLILVEQSEYALYKIYEEILTLYPTEDPADICIIPILSSVTNAERMRLVVAKYHPHIIYHAAAYKHVPLVESNVVEGVRNNSFGTLVIAQIALELSVPNFILISTDKAVRPTNVMGASKRLAEMILQALSEASSKTVFSMVRFGNVLDSSGSVVPKFRRQIKDGGPVTITDFRMSRYFMTIPEAAQLVIQASSLALGGELFLLDMGNPVKIVDLARRMIVLSGLDIRDDLNPNGDIEIKEIGLRPGEKLYEELLIEGSPQTTLHPRIFQSNEQYLSWAALEKKLAVVLQKIDSNDPESLIELLKELVDGYSPEVLSKYSKAV